MVTQLLCQKHLESVSLLLIIVKLLVWGILTERSGKGAHCTPGAEWLGVGWFWPVVTFQVCQDISSVSNITSAEAGSLWPQNVYSCFKVILKISNSFANKCHLQTNAICQAFPSPQNPNGRNCPLPRESHLFFFLSLEVSGGL